MSTRRLSKAGLTFIASWEGYRAKAYKDIGGVWTIGFGHTGGVKSTDSVTREQALELLRRDAATAETAVRQLVEMPINQDRFDALVSFTFNVGVNAFKTSTLLRKLNAGDYPGVPAQLMRWNKVNGRPVQGLTRRRRAEADLWKV
jgi:lysozyme